jgi:hypothetical protein
VNIEDLDGQNVAWFGVRHRDGSGERVEAVPIESVEGADV